LYLLPGASIAANGVPGFPAFVLPCFYLCSDEAEPSILDGNETEGLPGIPGEVEFRSVNFKYSDATEPVLENISFTAKHGETVTFIGSTGSGKSTLINLGSRFFDATDGEILIDGVNVRDYK